MTGNTIMTLNRMGVLLTLCELIARENTGECLKAIRVKMPDFQMPQGLIKPIDGFYRTTQASPFASWAFHNSHASLQE